MDVLEHARAADQDVQPYREADDTPYWNLRLTSTKDARPADRSARPEEPTCTIEGLCGCEMWTWCSSSPRSKCLCWGMSKRTGAVFSDACRWRRFWIEWIGWKADDEFGINDDGIVISFDWNWWIAAFFTEDFDEKNAESDRVGPAGATIAVGRFEIPTGGFAVNKAGGVDRSIGSESFWDSNQRDSATQYRSSCVFH